MPKSPTKSSSNFNRQKAQDDHLARLDTAISNVGGYAPEFQTQKPESFAKLMRARFYILSDDYDPDIGEIIVAEASAAGTAQAVGVSVSHSEKAKKKGPAYKSRNELIKSIAQKFQKEKPDYPGNRNDEIRKLIIEALECRTDRTISTCRLDEWFGDDDVLYCDENLNRLRKGSGEVIAAKTIGNILSTLK